MDDQDVCAHPEKTKLPCAFMFKRCTISGTGIYVTIYAKCSDCKATFKGTVANKPPKNSAVRLECRVSQFNPSVKHVTKPPLNGDERVKVSEALDSGAFTATTWRRKQADEKMDFYDSEPPDIPSAVATRKALQQRRDEILKVKGINPILSLQNIKYTDYLRTKTILSKVTWL